MAETVIVRLSCIHCEHEWHEDADRATLKRIAYDEYVKICPNCGKIT